MALFAIGDLHLSLGTDKPMDIFGGWDNYVQRIEENWAGRIKNEDTVVLLGDTSWAMNIKNCVEDFSFLEKLPGKKILLKGNHDYWWASVTSMKKVLEENNIFSIDFLHNNSYTAENFVICGSRGWLFENGAPHDEKIIKREAMRIEASLVSARDENREKLMFLHYPPIFGSEELGEYIEIMKKYGVKRCYYGHIHGLGHKHAFEGIRNGIEFFMVSADYLKFSPFQIV